MACPCGIPRNYLIVPGNREVFPRSKNAPRNKSGVPGNIKPFLGTRLVEDKPEPVRISYTAQEGRRPIRKILSNCFRSTQAG